MSVDAANDAVKRAARRIGLTGDFGSHSLRTGFTTDAIDAGVPREHVQHHGGWKNAKSLDNYIRKSSTWGDTNPALRLVHTTN
jgi:integrase